MPDALAASARAGPRDTRLTVNARAAAGPRNRSPTHRTDFAVSHFLTCGHAREFPARSAARAAQMFRPRYAPANVRSPRACIRDDGIVARQRVNAATGASSVVVDPGRTSQARLRDGVRTPQGRRLSLWSSLPSLRHAGASGAVSASTPRAASTGAAVVPGRARSLLSTGRRQVPRLTLGHRPRPSIDPPGEEPARIDR